MTTFTQTKPEFSVRLVVCDHYLTKPTPGIDVIYSEFRGSDIKQVPILRVFGPSPDGHKACLHIHGVFPYFYIPCPIPNPEPQFLYKIAASLDKALNIALKQATSSNQHVYKISLVKGLPFYGFHDKEHLYLKVFLYNPGLLKQAVELCSNGSILGQAFQPHEAHLNFTLQFFIDFNLFGMSNIDLQKIKFRRSGISQNSNEPIQSPEEISLKPESICFYEADCIASHIINRQRVGKGDGIENPGLEEVWNQEKERRKHLNVSMASNSLSQGRIDSDETESHYKFDQMIRVKMSELIDKPVDLKNVSHINVNDVHYPAESLEGSQLFKAVDVSMHLPENKFSWSDSFKRDMNVTLTEDIDNTIIDEHLALNCSLSLHYSQVLLDSEDLELVDLLQDMDDKPIEEDSVLGTPAEINRQEDTDSDDAEYSQIFNEDTILMEPYESKDDADDNSPSWNDSFWDGANIPQLDGTCDDDHVKKVRKRKMRPFKLGLSKPKNKKNKSETSPQDIQSKSDDVSDLDEINASRETIESISELHLKRSVKKERASLLPEHKDNDSDKFNTKNQTDNESIADLVDKFSIKTEPVTLDAAETYDLERKYEPISGPSHIKNTNWNKNTISVNHSLTDSQNYSSPEDASKLGIMSFYDKSRFFDFSVDDINETPDSPKPFNDHIQHSEMQLNSFENVNDSDIDPQSIDGNKSIKVEDDPKVITPNIRAPTRSYVISTLDKYNIPHNKHPQPYYSDHKDVGDKVELGQVILKLQGKFSRDQKPLERVLDTTSIEEWRQLMFLQTNEMNEECAKPDVLKTLLAGNRQCILTPVIRPPKKSDVLKYIDDKAKQYHSVQIDDKPAQIIKNNEELDNSQALGLNEDEIDSSISLEPCNKEKDNIHNTSLQVSMQPDGSFLCFGNSESEKESPVDTPTVEVDYLTVMLIEVHASVRGDLHPNPLIDPIQAVFLTVTNDCPPNHFLNKNTTEIVVDNSTCEAKHLDRCALTIKVTYVNNENEMVEKIIDLVTKHDPDIMCGYDMEMNSWGYFLERAQVLGFEIVKEVSRITEKHRQKKKWRSDDNDFEGKIIGRITFNVWRLLRYELALSSYSFDNCMYEILKERVPTFSFAQLAKWWNDESRTMRWIPVEHYLTRLSGTVRMLEKLDLINRTSELARLFGLQWWEVLSRGSQFRVESLMLRAARPLNLVALSPTVRQRAAMKAPECLPLIFEPESRYYSDPVIVLDFQSLYPSMMIAYNYCFSTCIGRVQHIDGESAYEFGAWRLRISKSKLDALVSNGLVHWSPVGVGFVKPSVRRGVLPALLRRILAARQAVKKGMKLQTDDAVKKAMHSRQLGLKLIANVTYGYTAANFSGRMPCVEVGDSVVSKGRETLERAIKLVKNGSWNARVVYGDTDSMFVLVPGGTREEAFRIGQEIADAVTADNPSPVALKLEKVYQPCILQTKKRYVGFMYESPEQATPVYEAKGIETVRRDGCPAGVKLLQNSLCSLFTTGDMSAVKSGIQSILSQLCSGALPPQELFFTREYHGPAGYRAGAAAPPKEIANRISSVDPRAVPRAGWRVRWLVCAGAPGTPLVRLARTPQEVSRHALTPHVTYYATRVLLPPLHRCLSLLGADVFAWWRELSYSRVSTERSVRGGITRYMWRVRCAGCGAGGTRALCTRCGRRAPNMHAKMAEAMGRRRACEQICQSCCGHRETNSCENTECPVLWSKLSVQRKLAEVTDILDNLQVQRDHVL